MTRTSAMARPLVMVVALLAAQCAQAQTAELKDSEQKTERKVQQRGGTEPSALSVEVSAGVESDSNVSVNELDANTGEGDMATLVDVDLDYELALDADSDLRLGYGFSRTDYEDFGAFDLDSHLATAAIDHDFGTVDATAAYRLIHARLGGHDYLTMQQASPSIARFFGKKLFVRAEYTYSDRDFADIDPRDATVNAGGADLYWFLKGVRRYVVIGYRYRRENATDAQYDFDANDLKFRLTQRFRMLDRVAILKLGWLYEQRDYSALTPAIGRQRDDDRVRFDATLEIPLGEHFFTVLGYEHGGFSSNLPSADYEEDVVNIKVGLKY